MKRGRPLLIVSGTAAVLVASVAGTFGLPMLLRFLEESRWINQLRSENIAERREAAAKLAKMQSLRAIPALIDLTGEDPSLSSTTLRKIGGKAVPILVPALRNKDPNVRKYVALTLGGMRAGSAAKLLAENLRSDPEVQARVGAVIALRSLGPLAAPVIPSLIKALQDVSPAVRYRAAHALRRVGRPARNAEAALRRALNQDPDVRVRIHAGIALVAVGVEGAELLRRVRKTLAENNTASWGGAEVENIEDDIDRMLLALAFPSLRREQSDGPPSSAPLPPSFKPIVMVVDDEDLLVVLSVGKNGQVTVGEQFTVARGDSFVGKVSVIEVYPIHSGARVLFTKEGQKIRSGDSAFSTQ